MWLESKVSQGCPQTTDHALLVNVSYLVSLFCRRGKPSHSRCKGPAQISHCESQSGASQAGSHCLQTHKVMVMFKYTQLKHTLMHLALLTCKNGVKGLLADIALNIFLSRTHDFYTLNVWNLSAAQAFCLGSLITNSAMNLGEGGRRRMNSTSWEWDSIKAERSE